MRSVKGLSKGVTGLEFHFRKFTQKAAWRTDTLEIVMG